MLRNSFRPLILAAAIFGGLALTAYDAQAQFYPAYGYRPNYNYNYRYNYGPGGYNYRYNQNYSPGYGYIRPYTVGPTILPAPVYTSPSYYNPGGTSLYFGPGGTFGFSYSNRGYYTSPGWGGWGW